MPDQNIKTLTEAVSALTDMVSRIVQSAKPEHLNFLEKDDMNQRISQVQGLLNEIKVGKLDDPSLS